MTIAVTVHMIAQAHLDPVWLWRWTEGRAEALATNQSAIDRLEEYPDLHFTRGEAQVYQWIEDENPALFQAIQEKVDQGRWHIVNGMVIQPDMNLPQGESIVRQALLGKSYFQEKFGQEVRVAYCVDTFGHPGTLPQILKKCGFEHYVFMRPQEHEKDLPGQAFWWRSPDGTNLLTFRISRSYASWGDDSTELIEAALASRPEDLAEAACFFGIGNHGGGPTRAQIDSLIALNTERDDIDIRFSSLEAYFEAVKPYAANLPVVADELQYHAVGCYSVNSSLKRLHRQAEWALLGAERMTVLADLWAGAPPDREALHKLWHDLCFNQFHDILAGTCIKPAQDESEMALSRVLLSAREIADRAGRLVGEHVDTSGGGGTALVFNPFPYELHTYIEYEPWTMGQRWRAFNWGLVDEQGHPVSHQVIEAQPATGSSETRGYNRLVFPVDLPPLGYRLYRFDHDLPVQESLPAAQAHEDGLENEYLRLRLDPESGNIRSCLDKASGLELAGPGGWNVPQVVDDPSDTWSHYVRTFDQALGQFGNPQVTVADRGPLQASLYMERTWQDESGASGTWLQQLVLRAGVREVLIRNWLDWHGGWRTLKLAFDTALEAPQGLRDVPFGALAFPNDGLETPVQCWALVQGKSGEGTAGLALLNNGKYGCDLTGPNLRLTVLRSPPYGYHIPHEIGSKQRYDWIDQGAQEFTLVLRPFTGDWSQAGIVARARELNLPPQVVTMHAHPGDLPPRQALCSLDSAELELTALKPVEAGDGYLARIADRHGNGGQGTLTWQGRTFEITCKPYEVRAYRLEPGNGSWDLRECDFLERPV